MRRWHEQEAEAVYEAVEGKGRSAGEAKSAATHAIAAAAAAASDAAGDARGFDLGVSLPCGVSSELLILSLYTLGFRLGRRASRAHHVTFVSLL